MQLKAELHFVLAYIYSQAITAGYRQQQSGIFITDTETEALPFADLHLLSWPILASIQLQPQFIQLLL